MDDLVNWLRQNVPHTDQTTVVHGDFRSVNIPAKSNASYKVRIEGDNSQHKLVQWVFSADSSNRLKYKVELLFFVYKINIQNVMFNTRDKIICY